MKRAARLSRLEFIVPYPKRRTLANKILIQLIEADVESGFGLVDEAKSFSASGKREFSSRALQDAEGILTEIRRRLERLGESESAPFQSLVSELRKEIAAAEQETG
jgi:hypothetical protein